LKLAFGGELGFQVTFPPSMDVITGTGLATNKAAALEAVRFG
jgi:hypothetical protein